MDFHLHLQLLLILCLMIFNVQGLTSDGSALLAIKASIIQDFGSLSNWLESDATPCEWRGISCDPATQRVIALSLAEMNLSGTVAPEIGLLTSLVNISIQLNNFTGALPQEITVLSSLRYLNISHNNFTNDFPSNLTTLHSLEILDAYNNAFTGPLPVQLGFLPNLKHLHLGGSYFEGAIPIEYGSMRKIRYMALAGNSLTGTIPLELGNLLTIQYLYLGYYNLYEGGIPVELSKLKNLIRLDLSYCNLTGTIPPELGILKKLDSLFLQINSLTGEIPPELGDLLNLKSLDLSNNHLTGTIPASFARLQKLELVSLFRNQLHGIIPDFLGELPNLQVLYLWANNLTGIIPQQLGENGNLIRLDLSSNGLNGTIPPNLCYGGSLEILILLSNQLTGSIPDSLGDCTSLIKVRLGDNRLTGPIPTGFLSLHNLQMLELIGNQLSGNIVGDFDAPSLESLDLSENQLHGVLPDGVGNLTSLKNLIVFKNHLSGQIPSTIGSLSQLIVLDLSRNLFNGQIPDSISNCNRLTALDLSSNELDGSIPPHLSRLQVLGFLNLSRNAIKGTIPQDLERIISLSTADFSYNDLSGPIPKLEYSKNASLYVGNPGLCGGAGLPECKKSGGGGGGGSGAAAATPSSSLPLHSSSHDPGLLAWLVGALFSAALLVLIVGVCCFFSRYQQYIASLLMRCRGDDGNGEKPWKLTAFQRLDFSAAQVVECMNEDNIIGRGGSGVVYKGVMPCGDIVAVKKLSGRGKRISENQNIRGNIRRNTSSHDDSGFSAEIETLGKIRHRNIVKLLGYCSNNEANILVYEYMPNGSLGELLHGKKGALLDWSTRYKITLQAANGLCYLHHDCSPLIVHRDVKSNNILLDTQFQAHVADFGLAKYFYDSAKTESMSSIAGSYGYIAPEYAYTLKVNEKSDIYSFGVVLLELVSGRRPIEAEFGDGVDLVQWVRKRIQNKDGVVEVVDGRLGEIDKVGVGVVNEVMLVLRVALLCTNDLPTDRPTMRDVVQMLTDVKPQSTKSKGSSEFAEMLNLSTS